MLLLGLSCRRCARIVCWKYPAWGVQATRTAKLGRAAAQTRHTFARSWWAPPVCLYEGGEVMGGASKACLSRLQKEYQRLGKEPVPNVVAEPK